MTAHGLASYATSTVAWQLTFALHPYVRDKQVCCCPHMRHAAAPPPRIAGWSGGWSPGGLDNNNQAHWCCADFMSARRLACGAAAIAAWQQDEFRVVILFLGALELSRAIIGRDHNRSGIIRMAVYSAITSCGGHRSGRCSAALCVSAAVASLALAGLVRAAVVLHSG